MFDDDLRARAEDLVLRLRTAGLMLATAESCTGGLVAGLLTEVPGSSAVLERGFVTYSNEAKTELLGVPAETIAGHGAVSRETAAAMAAGTLRHARAALAVSITGIAGPGGGSPDKPVGLVHFAFAARSGRTDERVLRFGDLGRTGIRRAAVLEALDLVVTNLG